MPKVSDLTEYSTNVQNNDPNIKSDAMCKINNQPNLSNLFLNFRNLL